jgi:hypothetical protein
MNALRVVCSHFTPRELREGVCVTMKTPHAPPTIVLTMPPLQASSLQVGIKDGRWWFRGKTQDSAVYFPCFPARVLTMDL